MHVAIVRSRFFRLAGLRDGLAALLDGRADGCLDPAGFAVKRRAEHGTGVNFQHVVKRVWRKGREITS